MTYIPAEKFKRYCVRLSITELAALQRVKDVNGIPDASKAIRYCIEQEASRTNAEEGGK